MPDSEEGILIGQGYGVEASKLQDNIIIYIFYKVEPPPGGIIPIPCTTIRDDSDEDGIAFSFR